ncbi:hypothetical protein DSBG_2892 [Desulfosporosinus sp. BG]|nr:hypothetical protein DSBG_2892 [Desulfosporosinus sp. BG]
MVNNGISLTTDVLSPHAVLGTIKMISLVLVTVMGRHVT